LVKPDVQNACCTKPGVSGRSLFSTISHN